jgi:WD40 repeat protein
LRIRVQVITSTPFGGIGRWYGGEGSTVKALAWSPDSKYIASGDNDHTLRVWEAATGCVIATYTAHSDRINAVPWSPDGKYLVTGSQDHIVRVWVAP